METQKTTGRIGLIGMVLGLSVLCLLAPPEYALAAGTTYYVSLSGNDTNNGNTLDTAWRTIDHAVDHVSAGDTIYVVPGNYGAEHVTIATSGTASNPITITRYDTSGMITLKHDVGGEGNGIRVDGNYWIFEYFDVSDYHYDVLISGDHNTSNFCEAYGNSEGGFMVYSAGDHNVFNGCVAHDIINTGFGLVGSNNLIKDCVVSGIMGHMGIAMGHGADGNIVDGGDYSGTIRDTEIGIADATNTAIKNVEVHNCKDGIRTYLTSRNTTITNCHIHDMECESAPPRQGIEMGGSGTVSNNIVRNWGSTQYGIKCLGFDILLSENDLQGPSPEYRFHKVSSESCENIIIRDQKGDSFEIVTTKAVGLPTIEIEYTNGRVFKENSGTYTSHYYAEKSSLTLVGVNWVHWFITAYNMTATPASGSATVTVNRFDTSLPQGEILVDFTADTTDTNSVTFAVSGVIPNEDYEVKRDGAAFTTLTASDEGSIQFVNSEWAGARTFTIKQITLNSFCCGRLLVGFAAGGVV